jgi:hypothetical protein
MKSNTPVSILMLLTSTLAAGFLGCGTTPAVSSGNVTLQTHQLAGSGAASLQGSTKYAAMAGDLVQRLLGIQNVWAAVSSFATFKACNDTLKLLDDQGHQLTINGSQNPSIGQGLLTFDPASGAPMTLGALTIPAGTVLSEIDITFAVVPSVCGGANYAVEFDNGTGGGVRDITQNTAFKFTFASGRTITGSAETIDLRLGDIVNAMVAKGSALDNSTIQTINVGQAQ